VTAAQLFRYAEAYCLIPYVTPDGEREVIWNSRDGYAPFTITSRTGEPAALETLWNGEPFAPLHVPAVGDRIFVDLTEARARVFAARRVERVQARERAGEFAGLPPLDVIFPTREAAVESAFLDIYKPGVPDILVVTAGYLDQLQGERAAAAAAEPPARLNPKYAEFLAWLETLPAAVRDLALKYPAVNEHAAGEHDNLLCYRSNKNPLYHYTIRSYDDDKPRGVVTVTLIHGSDSTLPGVATFGQDPAQLLPCGCGRWEWPTAAQRDAAYKRMLDVHGRKRRRTSKKD
jgi:hypothetical protein